MDERLCEISILYAEAQYGVTSNLMLHVTSFFFASFFIYYICIYRDTTGQYVCQFSDYCSNSWSFSLVYRSFNDIIVLKSLSFKSCLKLKTTLLK